MVKKHQYLRTNILIIQINILKLLESHLINPFMTEAVIRQKPIHGFYGLVSI